MLEDAHKPASCSTAAIRQAFDGGAAAYHQLAQSHSYRMRLAAALELLPPRAAELIDLGCGPGGALTDLVLRAERVIAVDISEQMLAMARDSAAAAKNIEFVCSEIRDYIGTRRVSAALMLGVMEYQPDPLEFLADVVSRLQPGGVLVASSPNKQNIGRRANRWITRLVDNGKPRTLTRAAPLSTGAFKGMRHHETTLRGIRHSVETSGGSLSGWRFYNLSPIPIAVQPLVPWAVAMLERLEASGKLRPSARLGSGLVFSVQRT